jgi:hypothetical protein
VRIKTGRSLVTDSWPMPAGLKGNPWPLRVSASLAGRPEDTCPDYTATKARPAVSAKVRTRHPKARLEDFPLGRVQKALDMVELEGVSLATALQDVERCAPPLHDMQRNFIRGAVLSFPAVTNGHFARRRTTAPGSTPPGGGATTTRPRDSASSDSWHSAEPGSESGRQLRSRTLRTLRHPENQPSGRSGTTCPTSCWARRL